MHGCPRRRWKDDVEKGMKFTGLPDGDGMTCGKQEAEGSDGHSKSTTRARMHARTHSHMHTHKSKKVQGNNK